MKGYTIQLPTVVLLYETSSSSKRPRTKLSDNTKLLNRNWIR